MCLEVVSCNLRAVAANKKDGVTITSATPHECAVCLRILVDHTLPVLKHAITLAHSSDSAPGSPPIPPDVGLLLLGAAARILSHCLIEISQGGCDYNILAQGLQMSSSNTSLQEPSSSSSLQDISHPQAGVTAGQLQGTDDVVDILDAVLLLSHALVSGGPLWQEARANHPLLLLHTLQVTSTVSYPTVSSNTHTRACVECCARTATMPHCCCSS
jgi:hypothetical protein